MTKIVVTGAAGLVGQNLLALLAERPELELVAIDKQAKNLRILAEFQPRVRTVLADLAEAGAWRDELAGADALVLLHAQVTAKDRESFERNNLLATERVLDACLAHGIPYLVHVSSSVLHSAAQDHYARTKLEQERLVVASSIEHSILRPTLMFGCFDSKHLGWLARFMRRSPLFPLPGDGRYSRQPLYVRDFCRAVEWCLIHRPRGAVFDVTGPERIDFVDIVRAMRRAGGFRARIVPVPLGVFRALLRTYAFVSAQPPFTADQLASLTAGDDFEGVDLLHTFGIEPTPFERAIQETLRHPLYGGVVLQRGD